VDCRVRNIAGGTDAGDYVFVLAGVAMLSGILDALAARLLALMLLIFSVLVLAPGIFAHPQNHISWGLNAYNLAAVGAAWIFAESIAIHHREAGGNSASRAAFPQ
jgi:hypothetical protein